MSSVEIFALILAGCAAGGINAVAGGGTLLTFPALIFFGTPAIIANATSTVALVIGTAGGIYGYRRHLPAVRPWLRGLLPASILGGWIGSVLLTRTSETLFVQLVPFLVLFATLLFLAQGTFRRMAGVGEGSVVNTRPHAAGLAALFQFGVAVYGGYFGAGIGILMLASLGFLGLRDIHQTNGLKNVLGSLINLVAAAWFIASGLVDWPKAAIMTGGALAGYWLGAHYSQRIPQHRVRQLITAIGFTISAVMFWRQFG